MTERESGGVGERGTGAFDAPADRRSDSEQRPEGRAAAAAAHSAPSPTPPLSPSAVSAEALSWLDARDTPSPPELRERMAEALSEVQAQTLPGVLAEAALSCLKAAAQRPQERAAALDLLAADALLTYALEAATELGGDALRRMTESYGPDRLASLLSDEEAEE